MDYHTESTNDQYSIPEYSLFLWLALQVLDSK